MVITPKRYFGMYIWQWPKTIRKFKKWIRQSFSIRKFSSYSSKTSIVIRKLERAQQLNYLFRIVKNHHGLFCDIFCWLLVFIFSLLKCENCSSRLLSSLSVPFLITFSLVCVSEDHSCHLLPSFVCLQFGSFQGKRWMSSNEKVGKYNSLRVTFGLLDGGEIGNYVLLL